MLSEQELNRYKRHINLEAVGRVGQSKLKQAKVLVVGSGGLGSPVLLYLAAAGVGNITIVDADSVDESNLQRQVLFLTDDLGNSKAQCAKKRIEQLNPHINIKAIKEFINQKNAKQLVEDIDYIIDCSDNFQTRFLCNDLAFFENKVLIHGSVNEFDGMIGVFNSNNSACYRCLFPEVPKIEKLNCSQGGVLGVTPGIIGLWQATEVIKLILGLTSAEQSYSLNLNLMENRLRTLQLPKDDTCPLCSSNSVINELIEESPIVCTYEYEVETIVENSIVLDIRTSEEFEDKPSCFKNLSMDKILENPNLLDKSERYTFVCASGKRSLTLCTQLKPLGFTDIYSLKNGQN